MSLSSGQKLGNYEILELIGKGGMGEVYRAKDSKLGRDVAIKVLPEEFAKDAERVKRFKREAKVLASLNHTNIASIYGLEQSGSTHYLVLELVEGETLAERIARGPIPIEESLEISTKIADALEEAHEHGIVHRDLKPPNVKITPRDEIKVLDFGLAKAFAEETQQADSSMSPTITRDATRVGVILGTAAYMSPEQAKGKHVDKRTDIFAFGAVLYEMLTGKKAFAGDDVSEVLAAVIKLEPDWNALPNNLSARLMELLHRCLEKDPKKRRRDIGDVRSDITSVDVEPTGERRAEGASAWRLAAMSAIAAGLLVGGLMWSLRAPPAFPSGVIRFGIDVEGLMGPAAQQALAISPDGRRIVNSRATGGLYLREMDASGEERVIPGTEQIRATEPFFSPDGNWVGFYADTRLQKISVRGGEPITISETDPPKGVTWTEGDFIVFGQGSKGIHRVSAEGGEPDLLIEVDEEEGEFAFSPQVLPDEDTVVFTLRSSGGLDNAQIVAQSIESGARNVLVTGARDARFVPPGYLVYARGDTLMAVAFDLDRIEVNGAPSPAIAGVRSSGSSGMVRYDVSNNGTLVYQLVRTRQRTAAWVDRSGTKEPLSMPARAYAFPRISPDGKVVAAIIDGDLWICEIERELWSRSTSTGDILRFEWAPDGSIVFSSHRNGVYHIYRQTGGAASVPEQLTSGTNDQIVSSVSPDGQMVAFHEHTGGGGTEIWIVSVDAPHELEPFVQTQFADRQAKFSPDGSWIAYVSDERERGRTDVYIRRVDGSGDKVLVSPGDAPMWSPDGRELFFVRGGDLMAVDIRMAGATRVGEPRILFDGSLFILTRGLAANYDITPDGEQFFVLSAGSSSGVANIQVVVNWNEELKRLVNSGKD